MATTTADFIALQALQPDLRIVTAGGTSETEYETLRANWNLSTVARPLAIIVPNNENELAAAVQHCTALSPPLPLTVRSGGHDVHGRHIIQDAVLLDVSGLNSITVSPDRKSVTIGGGVRSLQLLQTLDAAGLATAVGWCGTVGVVGWACGGGYGITNGVWGMGAHNILGARIVTPSGRIVDTDHDPDLLWAVRGAGLGNFGVISQLRLIARPRPRQLAGMVAFPLVQAKEVLCGGLQKWSDEGKLPRNFNGEFSIATTEMGSGMTFWWSWIVGDEEDGEESIKRGWEFLEEFKALGTVLMNTVQETTLYAYKDFLNGIFQYTGHCMVTSNSVAKLAPEFVDVLIANPPPPGGAAGLTIHHAHPYRPDAGQPSPGEVAYPSTQEHYLYGANILYQPGTSAEDIAVQVKWVNAIYDDVVKAGMALDTRYWSFARSKDCDSVSIYGAGGVERLKKLKAKYNPEDAFPGAFPTL
ncbi:hypothetical protein B0H63DRAFT_564084 [Podospora didyma]|uniref:FAD-binding PCMH-type domain-containing protein n=1 Tax=Podospora didyma TaxID=330526 RepID=A0AAE0K9R8_9PEZI|nr:hypothetical protein B0H63DRAFT_564084 [Podospora didyma]